uniref:Caspase-8 n=1 Tax=Mola mola TaxID=94237 RepID=A0A3Q3WWQ6_MOLML
MAKKEFSLFKWKQSTVVYYYGLILNKIDEKKLITRREYNNLKSIVGEDVWGYVVALLDKLLNKGDDTCRAFLDLLQTDDDIKCTFPELRNLQMSNTSLLTKPVQYLLNSQPTGLCVIINNETFIYEKKRTGTNKDAGVLAEVFSWLGFRVLCCNDQTQEQIMFTGLQAAPEHGDAFVCCILSHGRENAVLGIDGKPFSIKDIIRTFKATTQSTLTGKPKMFLFQACRGREEQQGVLQKYLQTDDHHSLSIPEEADFLVVMSTVEDYVSFRHPIDGSWFIQSLCQQLKEGCPRGDDMMTILQRMNDEVSQKEASSQPGRRKQMPEVRFTLRKGLFLSPK